MLQKLFQTEEAWSLLILRAVLGIVFFMHGGQKLFGWFGGHGFAAAMTGFTVNMHIPWILLFW